GGTFLFTAESKDGDGFDLGPKRRWRHSERYLRETAERGGLAVSGLMPCVPRTEAGQPVQGWAVALAKSELPPSLTLKRQGDRTCTSACIGAMRPSTGSG